MIMIIRAVVVILVAHLTGTISAWTDCPKHQAVFVDSFTGDHICYDCTNGWVTSDDQMSCDPDCPPGTYYSGNAAGDEICAKCAKGAYSEGRSMFCLSCPDGDTTAGLGATSPDECYPESEEEGTLTCPAGHFAAQRATSCSECPANTFSVGGVVRECSACPAGKVSEAGSSECEKEPCEAGKYMSAEGCKSCSKNYYSEAGATQCTRCPSGKISEYASTSLSDCTYGPCMQGQYMTDSGCQHCPSNTYSMRFAMVGVQSCVACPGGSTSPPGSISVNNCEAGEPDAPLVCGAGQFNHGAGCQQCPENTFSAAGATSCTDCPSGTISEAASTSNNDCEWKPCLAGSFMNSRGCHQCRANTYSGDGASRCTSCPVGKMSAPGSTSVYDCRYGPCSAGDYMTDSGCEQCGENTFSGPGASSCTGCPHGKVSTAGSTLSDDCEYEPCYSGNYMTDSGCQQCGAKTYSGDGASSCTSCPHGKISDPGSFSVDECYYAPCLAGDYMTDSGCQQCGENSFSAAGASSCTSCAEGKISDAGSTSEDDCECEYGQTVDGDWTDWGNWSTCECDHTTGTGTWNRTRSCTNPAPFCYGSNCEGDLVENGTCHDSCCQTVNGIWSDWGNWSKCECDSETGTKNRTRTCNNPFPSCFGRECEGDTVQNTFCESRCKSILSGLFSADGPLGLSKPALIFICCLVGLLCTVVAITAAMKISRMRKQRRLLEDANKNHEALGLVTECHFETPESSQGILLLNIESKVEPSMENIGLENDYIDFNGDTQEDNYIDFTGI